MWRHPGEWSVILLRAWYSLRERLGCPRKFSQADFAKATDTQLLAGSPWVWWTVYPSASSGTASTFAVTNATWPANLPSD